MDWPPLSACNGIVGRIFGGFRARVEAADPGASIRTLESSVRRGEAPVARVDASTMPPDPVVPIPVGVVNMTEDGPVGGAR